MKRWECILLGFLQVLLLKLRLILGCSGDRGLHLSSLQEGSSGGKGGAPQRSLGLPAQKVTEGQRGPPLWVTLHETRSQEHELHRVREQPIWSWLWNPFWKALYFMSLISLLFSTGKPQVLAEASASQASCSSDGYPLPSWTWKKCSDKSPK